MHQNHLALAPKSTYTGTLEVELFRLDSLLKAFDAVEERIHLKVDAQGYEIEVLEGASTIMDRIKSMQLELSLIPLYDGAPLIHEVLAYAYARGFLLYALTPVFGDRETGRVAQYEGYLVRQDIRIG